MSDASVEGLIERLRARKTPVFVEPDLDCVAAADAISHLAREKRALQERLEMTHVYDMDGNVVEVEPGSIPDGIFCRNETIKLQDENNARLRARATAAEARVKELEEALEAIVAQSENGSEPVYHFVQRVGTIARSALQPEDKTS